MGGERLNKGRNTAKILEGQGIVESHDRPEGKQHREVDVNGAHKDNRLDLMLVLHRILNMYISILLITFL